MSRRAVLLIVNPVSGGKPGSGPGLAEDAELLEAAALARALGDRGLEVRLHELAPEDDAGELARAAADEGCDVVAAGGDGTVARVARALVGHPSATLGILARGSFNNMARGFGIPVKLDAALDVIGAGRSTAVDVGWVHRDDPEAGRPFFEAAGVGLDAMGFMAVELYEKRGPWRALRALWRGIRRRSPRMRITLDGTAYRMRSPAVTVSNGPYFGLGFAVAAEADPTDGWLNVATFGRMNALGLGRYLMAVARRRPRRDPEVRTRRAREVTIEAIGLTLPAHADGESAGVTPITCTVRPGALRVFR